MDNTEKNYILALQTEEIHPVDQYRIDMAAGHLITGTAEKSEGKAHLGHAGALEILYELGRLMNRLDDF